MLQPVQPAERYRSLDLLRGFALFGVLIINLLYFFRISLWEHMVHPSHSALDTFCSVFIEFKAFDLFALTFGIGMAIQFDRARSRGSTPEAFLIRRFLVLLLFGLAHLLFISNVDILTLYAVCALVLTFLIRLPAPVLAVAGVAFIYGPDMFSFDLKLDGWAAAAQQHYAHGNFADILAFRWSETRALILPLLALTAQHVIGLMMVGIAVWRAGIIRTPERYRKWLWGFCVVAATIGLVKDADVPLALAYASYVIALRPNAAYVAAMGQMALTNYLTQSVVFALVFYGFGLRLFGRIALAPCFVSGIVFYVIQLIFSRWWLQRHRFGPCEWLWRSLTYGRRVTA